MQMEIGTYLKGLRLAISPEARHLGDFARLAARVGKPVTQEEAAESLGISRTWYAMLEGGAARASVSLTGRIADAFKLTSNERAQLIRLALPAFGADLLSAGTEHNLELWKFAPPQPTVTLAIASPNEIEATARRLATLRDTFLSTGEIALPGARQRILDSWLRSRSADVSSSRRIAPLSIRRDAELDELRLRNERLLRAARPILTFLMDRLGDSGYVVVLSDENGRILELHGAADVRRRLEHIEFVPGGNWSEEAAGTNAIGTALTDGRPLQLMAAEHFCDGWQHLTCTAAPIRDPETHAIIGVVDITGGYELVRAHLLALIMQAALEIEERLALRGLATL
jgi:transcriptional regulator with XRE-family HTH domain